MEIVSIIIMC